MISKRKIAVTACLVVIIFAFDIFERTPLGIQTRFIGMALSTIGFGLLFMYFRQFPYHLRKFGLLFLTLFILSISSSYFIYNQSITSGIIANSSIYLSGSAFLVYYIFVKYRLDLETVKSHLLSLSWTVFIIFAFLFLTGIAFVSNDGENVFGVGSLKKDLINLGAVIYLVRFFQRNKNSYLFFALILFSVNHWADFQRYIFFVFIMVFASMLFFYRNRGAGIRAIALVLFVSPILITVLSATQFGEQFSKKINAVFALFEDDSQTKSDSSIDARFSETAIAMASIKQYPITGIGRIRSSTKSEVTGDLYFHVTDIGLIGIMYSFGILGVLIFLLQFHYLFGIYKNGRFMAIDSNREFKLFLLFLLLYSILTGKVIYSPTEFIIMVGLIELGNYRYKLELDE